jgi:hypothetical protein
MVRLIDKLVPDPEFRTATQIQDLEGYTTLIFGDTGFEIDIYEQREGNVWSGRFDVPNAKDQEEIIQNSLKYVYGVYLLMAWLNDGGREDLIESSEYLLGDTNERMHKSRQTLLGSLDNACPGRVPIYEEIENDGYFYSWRLNLTPLMNAYNTLLVTKDKEELRKIKFFKRLYQALEVYGDGKEPQQLFATRH